MDLNTHFVLAKFTAFFVIDDLINRWETLNEDSKLNILVGLRETLSVKIIDEYFDDKS